MWVTEAPVSHCFVLINDPILGDMVMQATSGGVQINTLKTFKLTHNIVTVIEPKVDLSQAIKEIIEEDLGDGYDYTGDLGVAWIRLGKWLGKKWHNIFHTKKHEFCSALLTKLIQKARWPGSETLVPDEVDPGELLKFVSKP